MFFQKAPSYPIPLAIRLVLDSNSYRNPLPNWFDVVQLDYISKNKHLRSKLKEARAGHWDVPLPDPIFVPKKSGRSNRWLMLSTNQQILLQAIVSLVAEDIHESLPSPNRVFSYRLNQDPSRLRFIDEQLPAWFDFQATTRQRVKEWGFVLQIDIERAFASVRRDDFFEWMRRSVRIHEAVDLLVEFLHHIDSGGSGIPFIGESVFFLGNAYFSTVDRIVARRTTNFIRFVDDYRIFGHTVQELEGAFERINEDLRTAGFAINDHKVMLACADDFEEVVCQARPQPAPTAYATGEEIEFADKPRELACWIDKAVSAPERYLNEGFGRFLLGRLRQYRFEELVASQRGNEIRLGQLSVELDARPGIAQKVSALIERYSTGNGVDESWRLVWLVHLLEFARLWSGSIQRVERLASSHTVSECVQLWAKRVATGHPIDPPKDATALESLHDRTYLDVGRSFYGG